MTFIKKLSTARSQITKSINEIPIKWGRYIDSNMQEQKVIFFGHEKAIYGSDGVRLDEKLIKIKDEISDAFSEEKDYAVGDYCIFLNSLYRFISAKPAGPWDGTTVIPVSIAQELQGVRDEVGVINSNFEIKHLQTSIEGEGNVWLDTGLSLVVPSNKRFALLWMEQSYSYAMPIGFQLRINKTGSPNGVIATYEDENNITYISPTFIRRTEDPEIFLYVKKKTTGTNAVHIYYAMF